MLDADTDAILLAARIEGVTGPKNHAVQELPLRPAKDVAEAIVALQASHSLSLPANDEAVAAMGFVGDITPEPLSERTTARGATFQVERRSAKAIILPRSKIR